MSDGAKRQAQVSRQMELLSDAISNCKENVANITTRLNPVLALEDPPSEGRPKAEVAESIAPLANSIRDLRYSVLNINKMADSILNRIEL